ncbi:hypothetical protein Q9966_009476 [Columba livia]|nr:hypothetical protein Q9966_009476 [Columba livia]
MPGLLATQPRVGDVQEGAGAPGPAGGPGRRDRRVPWGGGGGRGRAGAGAGSWGAASQALRGLHEEAVQGEAACPPARECPQQGRPQQEIWGFWPQTGGAGGPPRLPRAGASGQWGRGAHGCRGRGAGAGGAAQALRRLHAPDPAQAQVGQSEALRGFPAAAVQGDHALRRGAQRLLRGGLGPIELGVGQVAPLSPPAPSPAQPGITPASSPQQTTGPCPQLSRSGSPAHPLGTLCIKGTVPPLRLRVQPPGSPGQIAEGLRIFHTPPATEVQPGLETIAAELRGNSC